MASALSLRKAEPYATADWDSGGRTQTVDTNAVSSFSGGGHVKLRVSYGTGYNAVVNGVFFR